MRYVAHLHEIWPLNTRRTEVGNSIREVNASIDTQHRCHQSLKALLVAQLLPYAMTSGELFAFNMLDFAASDLRTSILRAAYICSLEAQYADRRCRSVPWHGPNRSQYSECH